MPLAKTSVTLPGGYKVGDKVFYTGSSKTWDDGDKLVHGQQGEVTGPGTARKDGKECVAVLFHGNKDLINCSLTSARRLRAAHAANPHGLSSPLPGGRDGGQGRGWDWLLRWQRQ